MKLNGDIIAGEFDKDTNAFMLQQVKHLSTASALSENQLGSIYDYLTKHEDEGQVLTLNDQMPVRLTQREVRQVLDDLDKIKSMYH